MNLEIHSQNYKIDIVINDLNLFDTKELNNLKRDLKKLTERLKEVSK